MLLLLSTVLLVGIIGCLTDCKDILQTCCIYLLRELATEGAVDGIEVYHPSNSAEDSTECLALCKQYGLVATAGTDFHGRNHKHPHPIGTCTAPDEAAAQLRAIAEKRKRERT